MQHPLPVPLVRVALSAGALLALPLASCRATAAAVQDPAAEPPSATSSWFVTPAAADPGLYPAAEGPTDAPPSGAAVEEGPFPHDMQPTGTGRMYLLELYQRTIEDKEALEREVAGLTSALDHAHSELGAREAELERARSAGGELESEAQRLAEENRDLAARLATAQIRRLEAEKMLLEAKIEWARYLEEGDGGLEQRGARRP